MDKERRSNRKYLRFKDACEAYSLGKEKMHDLAVEARAIYKIDRAVLVNCDVFERHLESYYKLV